MSIVGRFLPLFAAIVAAQAQTIALNRAPQFSPNGDMSRFAIPEDTPPGTSVYRLMGVDPEGSRVFYRISGEYFKVDKNTGVVSTLKSFDREKEDLISVVISITDESSDDSEPNTVSHLRQIPILDINDNHPEFFGRPYSVGLFENTPPGKIVFDLISVRDEDGGINGDVILSCTPPDDETCKTFDVATEKVAEGRYKGVITLLKPLDFETRTSYGLTVKATDRAKDPNRRLTATANVAVDVLDVQDQPPVFVNAPYSSTVPENTQEGTSILKVAARDGDVGDPRTVRLEIRDDYLGHFKLVPLVDGRDGEEDNRPNFYSIVTTDVPLDRENPDILQNGGIYTFTLRATELINNELPADYAETTVTIVVMDEDDQLPSFNRELFHVNVSENIGLDSPLPGLNLIITDEDIGENARYYLSLREIRNVENTFAVQPKSGTGRTAIVVRVNDTKNLDYDVGDEDLRILIFEIVAEIGNEESKREVGKARVEVRLEDANDNAPEFGSDSFYVSVGENAGSGTLVSNASATDKDSGVFGEIRYYLKGFGARKFRTDRANGGIYTASDLDYETQKSYTLNLIAIDGGNKTSSANVYIDVEDANDNRPEFEYGEYNRILREGAKSFQPEFYVRAVDPDGPEQGGGKIYYEIVSRNHNGDVFDVDHDTGELTIKSRVSSGDTAKGQYEMVVRAWDYGSPRSYGDARVNVRVGVPGNQRPLFRGNARNEKGISIYRVEIKENCSPNVDILKLEAFDPDGPDSRLVYKIAQGGNDNFLVEETTGIVKTSPYSNFDLEMNPNRYELTVAAIDAGSPVPETGSTTVFVTVRDVNNKPPVFEETNYSEYVNENAEINSTILTISARDPDENHAIAYRIVKPLRIYNRAGSLTETDRDLVSVNETTGEIVLNSKIERDVINYVIFKAEAEDVNGEENEQKATAEITLYVRASTDENPVFLSPNWTAKNPVIKIRVNEELEKNSVVYSLRAKDPMGNKTKFKYESIGNDHYDLFDVSENGNVIVLKKLDYESLERKSYDVRVRAIVNGRDPYRGVKNAMETVADGGQLSKIRYVESVLTIEIVNVNDNAPVFDEESYTKRIPENVRHPEVVLRVRATDSDGDRVRYRIGGENSNYFSIDETTGEIAVAENVSLDREKRRFYRFNVTGSDRKNGGGRKGHKTTVQATVEVLDVNDNPPVFARKIYSAVVPENVDVGTMILRVHATDPDLGSSGEVEYGIVDESDAEGFFRIDPETGEIVTDRILTGKGRAEPYNVVVRASDKGDRVLGTDGKGYQKSLASEVTVSIYVGDVVKNDGVPIFIKPGLNERVRVPENASANTAVFQAVATDPDSADSAEGQIRYKFLSDGKTGEENPFKVHPETGLISTRGNLDRETRSSYDLIIVAEDGGEVPQQAVRRLKVEVTDVDDHKPHFKRSIDESPLLLKIVEECPIGSEVGSVEAIDEDTGENALIDYVISHGNDDKLFEIERTDGNVGVIRTSGRIDRERAEFHTLTVKCFKMAEDGKKLDYARPYNRQDPSERQIRIIVEDVDDNDPKFVDGNLTIGVRLNVPPDTSLLTIQASDEDGNSPPVEYRIANVTFATSLAGTGNGKTVLNATEKLFRIDEKTGELKTAGSLQKYSNGFFDIDVYANNTVEARRRGNASIRVFMLRDKSLMKFVLDDPPTEVRKRIPELEAAIAAAAQVPRVNVYDVQFHSKPDGSLDFSSTSSCFQIVGKRPYTIEEMESILNDPKNKNFKKVFAKFNIREVTRCAYGNSKGEISWIEIWVLALSALVGILAMIALFAIVCMHERYKAERKKRMKSRPPSTADYMTIRTGTQLISPATAGSAMGSQLLAPNSTLAGSQLYISKSDGSVLGSQFAVPKGSQLIINQPAAKMGSQLMATNPKSNCPPVSFTGPINRGPIIVGTSQMVIPNSGNPAAVTEDENYEDGEKIFAGDDFGSQMMYEYIGDGMDNTAFEDDS